MKEKSWEWEYHPSFTDNVIALTDGENDVLICTGNDTYAFGIISETDAALISATPQLLAALKSAMTILTDSVGDFDWSKAKAAIDKAEMR
jgi:hypothetical protein